MEGVVIYATVTTRPVYGWYCTGAWHDTRSGQRFAEIVINADTLDRAEQILTTLVRELVHAYAATTGQRDTSRRGDYHNATVADLAIKAGLDVRRHRTRGHVTTGISPLGHVAYGSSSRRSCVCSAAGRPSRGPVARTSPRCRST